MIGVAMVYVSTPMLIPAPKIIESQVNMENSDFSFALPRTLLVLTGHIAMARQLSIKMQSHKYTIRQMLKLSISKDKATAH